MEMRRNNFRWNIDEVLRLQREYELLGMSVQEIAKLHGRSARAILCKLEKEEFIGCWNDAKGFSEFVNSEPHLIDHKSLILNASETTSEIDSETDSETELNSSILPKDLLLANGNKELNMRLMNVEKTITYLSNLIKPFFEKKSVAKELSQSSY
jgi:hypothetical protein